MQATLNTTHLWETELLQRLLRDSEAPVRLVGDRALQYHITHRIATSYNTDSLPWTLVTTIQQEAAAMNWVRELGFKQGDRKIQALNSSVIFLREGEQRIDLQTLDLPRLRKSWLLKRFYLQKVTLPIADLLLTTLQQTQLPTETLLDVASIIYHAPVTGDDREDGINAQHIAFVLSNDWSLWTECMSNFGAMLLNVRQSNMEKDKLYVTLRKIYQIMDRIEDMPKSLRFKLASMKKTKFSY